MLPDDSAADVEDRVRLAVAGGYDGAEAIVEALVELVEYDPATEAVVAANRDEVVAQIQQMVDSRMAEYAAAESAFPSTTDCDRLTAAFARLEADGVLAREDVGYTQSDLRDEMWELVDRAGSDGRQPRGWVAFHGQDVERVIESGVLYISFAAVSDDDEGFGNGDPNRRVEIRGMQWQKRRRHTFPI